MEDARLQSRDSHQNEGRKASKGKCSTEIQPRVSISFSDLVLQQ